MEEPRSYLVECPHCGGLIEIARLDINCGVFRHDPRLHPHADKAASERVDGKLGCGKPFRFDGTSPVRTGYES